MKVKVMEQVEAVTRAKNTFQEANCSYANIADVVSAQAGMPVIKDPHQRKLLFQDQ